MVGLLLATRRWRAAALVGGLAVAVVAVGLAPFVVVDRRDIVYAFVTWHGREPIGGNSLWSIFKRTPAADFSEIKHNAVAFMHAEAASPLAKIFSRSADLDSSSFRWSKMIKAVVKAESEHWFGL